MAKVAQKTSNKKTRKYSKDNGKGNLPGRGPGRPRGSKNKRTILLNSLMENEAETMARKAINLALAGNVEMLKFCLSRLLPPAKSLPIEVNLNGKRGIHAIDEVIEQTAKGAITPEAALALTQIMERRENIYAVSELEQRITLLESGAPVIGIGEKEHGTLKPN